MKPTEINLRNGIGRVWELAGTWSWAHPDGSQGCDEPTYDAAVAELTAYDRLSLPLCELPDSDWGDLEDAARNAGYSSARAAANEGNHWHGTAGEFLQFLYDQPIAH